MNSYKYGKEFDSLEKLTKYLSKIENLEDAKVIKADDNGTIWILQFNKNELKS